MENDVYAFEILKLDVGDWSLVLLKNGHVAGGYVGSDFDDLHMAGNNWLVAYRPDPSSHQQQSQAKTECCPWDFAEYFGASPIR
jgi:hypothetical protein